MAGKGLYANIAAKKRRIAAGSGEKMRKPGAKGAPTKAAIGFARGKGLGVADLTRKQTPKGEVVCALIKNKGRSTSSLLNDYLPQLIHEIPFQKKNALGK